MTTGEVRHSPLTLVVALQQEVSNISCIYPVRVCSATVVLVNERSHLAVQAPTRYPRRCPGEGI